MENDLIRLDGLKWKISRGYSGRSIHPLCPVHSMQLSSINDLSYELVCEDCPKPYKIPRNLAHERRYVLDKFEAKSNQKLKVLNLDDEAIPIAEDKKSTKDKKYFITSVLTESKTGKRLVIYAGEKGRKEKTQIFVEPDIKRLAFDQKDLHPTEIFTKLEATFPDGSTAQIKRRKK